jgi:UDP-N-acetylglucosamine 2-epimerase (non-hydrolysing)
MKIHLIAAARPNFMKIAPLYHALKKESWADPKIVHTGQHYDLNMSDVFFHDLKLPVPDIHLGVGSGSHAEQTGQVMMAYEKVLMETHPDLVIVVGDVNSTVACTRAAVKLPAHSSKLNAQSNIQNPTNLTNADVERSTDDVEPTAAKNYQLSAMSHELNGRRPLVGHLEAGLRSYDRTMPEEINRMVTDVLVDILWTPSPDGDENLIKEGIAEEKIDRVGNIMIDSLEMLRGIIEKEDVCSGLALKPGSYGLLTLHRPSNVDDPEILADICEKLIRISQKIPLVFPVHPRTRKNMEKLGLMPDLENAKQMVILEPLNYIRFMNLVFNCRFALTDSGGIQEETSYLGIPCLTLRPNTERPITITAGTNRLCTANSFENDVDSVLAEPAKHNTKIDLWDGQTASRVVKSIRKYFKI